MADWKESDWKMALLLQKPIAKSLQRGELNGRFESEYGEVAISTHGKKGDYFEVDLSILNDEGFLITYKHSIDKANIMHVKHNTTIAVQSSDSYGAYGQKFFFSRKVDNYMGGENVTTRIKQPIFDSDNRVIGACTKEKEEVCDKNPQYKVSFNLWDKDKTYYYDSTEHENDISESILVGKKEYHYTQFANGNERLKMQDGKNLTQLHKSVGDDKIFEQVYKDQDVLVALNCYNSATGQSMLLADTDIYINASLKGTFVEILPHIEATTSTDILDKSISSLESVLSGNLQLTAKAECER